MTNEFKNTTYTIYNGLKEILSTWSYTHHSKYIMVFVTKSTTYIHSQWLVNYYNTIKIQII